MENMKNILHFMISDISGNNKPLIDLVSNQLTRKPPDCLHHPHLQTD